MSETPRSLKQYWQKDLTDALARARQEGIEQGRRERDAWKQLAEGLDALCVAYRTGTRRTPEKALDSIREARSILAAIRAQEPAHD